MKAIDWRDLALSFAVAGLGALVFSIIQFPAPSLTGSAVAIAVAGVMGLRTEMPVWLRNIAFILLGINIGTTVTPEMLASAAQWPLSIAVLLVCLIVSMGLTRWVLVRFLGFDGPTATLASAPGHLSYVLSLSLEKEADTARIAVVQSIRVLFIKLTVPLFVATWFGATGIDLLPPNLMTPQSLALSFGVTIAVGFVFTLLRLPAAYLLAGMFVSASLHVTSTTDGRMPDVLTIASFLTMGMLVGSRFSGKSWAELRPALAAGFWVTVICISVAIVGAVIVALAMGVPAPLLIVAFAPGGVEAMAAIAVILGLDPAFVAAHHVSRLLVLTFLIPFLVRVWK
ncbi:MAG: AbrB family transcriptional regulator [Pseudomonadota bacterium]